MMVDDFTPGCWMLDLKCAFIQILIFLQQITLFHPLPLPKMVNLQFQPIFPISTQTPQPLKQAWGPVGNRGFFGGGIYE